MKALRVATAVMAFVASSSFDASAQRTPEPDPKLRSAFALDGLLGDAKPDPNLTVLDDSVSVATWSTLDESVTQLLEADDGTVYAITSHSRGFTGDDRFTLAVVTATGFRDVPAPPGVDVVEFERRPGGRPYLAVSVLGKTSNFMATFSPYAIRVGKPIDPDLAVVTSEPVRSCPVDPATMRANAAAVTRGVSLDPNVSTGCALVGDLAFLTLNAYSRTMTYVADAAGTHAFSGLPWPKFCRDIALVQRQTPVPEGESSGYSDSYVLIRAKDAPTT